jgi:hypothetical protein
MRIKINFHDRQRDFAVLATFRGKVKALISGYRQRSLPNPG